MKISVIIPTYNRAIFLSEALQSVIKQQCVDFDIWVIDDGSTDNTREVVEQLQRDFFLGDKLHYVFQRNQGVSAARNLGIQKSQGEWIAFLDSDDLWLPNKLQQQLKHVEENPECQLVHTNERWERNGKHLNQLKKHRKEGGDIFIRSLDLCLISPSSVMIKRALFAEVGMFDTAMTVCEDYDLWLRITAKYPVCYLTNVLVIKRGGHADQLSHKFIAMDYWRVLAIHKLLQNKDLTGDKRSAAINILQKKVKILLNGYRKHNNMQHYDEIEQIGQLYIE